MTILQRGEVLYSAVYALLSAKGSLVHLSLLQELGLL